MKKQPQQKSLSYVAKEAAALFLDLLRDGEAVSIDTGMQGVTIKGRLYLRTLGHANEFINHLSENGTKPELKLEQAFSFCPLEIKMPKLSVMFDQGVLAQTVNDMIEDWFEDQNEKYQNPEDQATCHPILDKVLTALDAIALAEARQKGKERTSIVFSTKDNEQVIQTNTVVTVHTR